MTIILVTFFAIIYGLSCLGFYKEMDALFLESEENADLRDFAGYKAILGFFAFIWPLVLFPALVWKGVAKDV